MINIRRSLRLSACLGLLFISPLVFAGPVDWINNITSIIEAFIKLLGVGAYVVGLALIIGGCYGLYVSVKNQGQQPGKLAASIAGVVVGILLMYIPSTQEGTAEDVLGPGARSGYSQQR